MPARPKKGANRTNPPAIDFGLSSSNASDRCCTSSAQTSKQLGFHWQYVVAVHHTPRARFRFQPPPPGPARASVPRPPAPVVTAVMCKSASAKSRRQAINAPCGRRRNPMRRFYPADKRTAEAPARPHAGVAIRASTPTRPHQRRAFSPFAVHPADRLS
jgi:hypothetical protein